MILGYKQYFPWGKPTCFRAKIRNHIYDTPYSVFFPKDNQGNWMPAITVSARKIHTIREDIHNRWKPGMKIHHAHGVRTKNYDWFAESICESTQKIDIKYYDWQEFTGQYTYHNNVTDPFILIYIDDILIYDEEKINQLAKNDGFDSIEDFFRWFDKPFSGKIIHWTDCKY